MDTKQAEAILAGIDQRIAELERQKADLQQFITLGRKLARVAQAVSVDTAASFGTPTAVSTAAPMKTRVVDVAARTIRDRGPTHTRDLIPLIEAEGITITGADKPTTVSVILSRSQLFKSDRTIGWSLADKPHKEEPPQDAATSAGA